MFKCSQKLKQEIIRSTTNNDSRKMLPSQNRIVQLNGTYKDHPVHLSDHFRADQKLKHVIKGIVLIPLKHSQAWGINHLPGKPVPGFEHPSVKKRFQLPSLNLPWHCFEPFHMSYHWILGRRAFPLLRKLGRATRSPLSLLLSKPGKPRALRCSSKDMPSSPSIVKRTATCYYLYPTH